MEGDLQKTEWAKFLLNHCVVVVVVVVVAVAVCLFGWLVGSLIVVGVGCYCWIVGCCC